MKRNKQGMQPELLLYGKMPPQSIDLEGAVLGAVMLESSKLNDVRDIVVSKDVFYSDANQRIWSAICLMDDRGARIDFMTVCEELKKTDELDAVGGSYYVVGLTRDVVSSAHIEEHARIMIQKYIMRELIKLSGTIMSEAYDESVDCFDLLDKSQFDIELLSGTSIRKQYEHISASTSNILAEIHERMNAETKIFGVTTGWFDFDLRFGGFKKDNLIILAARPAVGKTAFSLNILLNVAMNKKAVGFFSLEMSKEQMFYRLLSAHSGINHESIEKGNLTPEQFDIIQQKALELNNAPIHWDDGAGLTIREIRVKVLAMKKKQNVELVIIDYLQLIEAGIQKGNREQEISYISRQLKKLSKELQIPIIALSQLNRAKSANTRPDLGDLRESGAIEQDADAVIFLWRPDESRRELICVDVSKHRHGNLSSYGARFLGDIQKFDQLISMRFSDDPNSVVFYETATVKHIEQTEEYSKPSVGIGRNGLARLLNTVDEEDLPF